MGPQLFFNLLQSVPQERLFGLDGHTLIGIIIQLASVIVLFVILKKLLHKPVTDFLKKREDRIEGDLQLAENEKVKANQFKLEYEQKVKDIAREREEILDAARKVAAERAKETEAAARSEAETIKTRALKDVELEQERAKAEVKQAIIECSSAMVSKFLTRAIDAEMQEKLFNETMAELEDVAWHN